ncbi:hypothetical protein BLNAU_19265 [Blattamonas nauphoetae]|uniref:Uncharacterized protein n=1 Tax=Blattamonas nauphoetae TaxID=2049346 RepID=A0ABQ9X4B4_9EUKA|nr:hypothetical protein BLNAU_19265 [Blattamonas nauphoetae]
MWSLLVARTQKLAIPSLRHCPRRRDVRLWRHPVCHFRTLFSDWASWHRQLWSTTRTTFAINYTKDHVFLMDIRENLNPNPRLVIGSSNISYDKATTLPDSEHQIITHHTVSTDDSNSELTSLDGSSRTRTFQAADSIAFIQVSNCQFSDQTFSGSGVVFSNSGTFHVLRAFDSLFENNKAGTKGGCISTHYSDHTSTDASFGRTQPLKEAAHTTSISQT